MDIIDIMLARAMTPQGQTEAYVSIANAAAAKAEKAEQDAASAIQTVTDAASDITSMKEEASDLLASAQEVLETAQQAQIALPEAYSSTGQNTDGYMTQKAVTDALNDKASITYVDNSLSTKVDITTFNSTINNYATTAYVNQKIASIPSSGLPSGVSNLGVDNAGKIVIIGPDGNIIAGEVTEDSIIEALIQSGNYNLTGTIETSVDYYNKNIAGSGIEPGSAFDAYSMFGGRMRCNVADDGTINAFYGDAGYTEDGSNGQVMVYQPKFYYRRDLIYTEGGANGDIIHKEQLTLSPTAYSGFTLHPLFKNNNIELDYILISAFEGSTYDTSANAYNTNDSNSINVSEDKLSSIAGVKPVSGTNKSIRLADLATLAANRGSGWQITNMEFESAQQMLMVTEYGALNMQSALGKGIVSITENVSHASAITGSTSYLGNTSGAAVTTTFDSNGTTSIRNTDGTRAISYRGMENPWGDLWRLVGNTTVKGNGSNQGGIPYINNTSTQLQFPSNVSTWISAMGIGNETFKWAFLPIECGGTANSAVPVGDTLWTAANLNGERMLAVGGFFNSGETGGPFTYNTEADIGAVIKNSNARLMYIPTKNDIYTANIAKWQAHYGG